MQPFSLASEANSVEKGRHAAQKGPGGHRGKNGNLFLREQGYKEAAHREGTPESNVM